MNEVFEFKFSFIELNTLIKGLKELPYKESNSVIEKIIKEYEKQSKEAQVAAKEAAKVETENSEVQPKDSKA